MPIRHRSFLLAIALFSSLAGTVHAADWPTWRHDANRSGASPAALPAKLHLQWVRGYMPQQPAWPDQAKMQFDIVREPVVAGRTMYINSSRYDAVRALDTRTGEEKWSYFADAPVRFAPAVWDARVYFSSDDGYLYCLQGDTGKLLWKFRGGPSDRKILGNERLISMWPARGAPVVADGKVYFAASIWPFMGIFVHALDARTGKVEWTNDGDGSLYMKQPHNTDSFASIAPQGPMVVIGDTLLVPGGRSVPAAFDRKSGKMLHYQLAENGKRGGGSEVAALQDVFYNGGAIFDLATEKYLADYGKQVVLTDEHAFTYDAKGAFHVFDFAKRRTQEATTTDSKGKKIKATRFTMPELATAKIDNVDTMIKAGNRLYLGGEANISALEWSDETKKLAPSWSIAVEGNVVRLIAADDRLFAVTREGGVFCYGGEAMKPILHAKAKVEKLPVALDVQANVERILKAAGTRSGYAVAWGVGDGRLAQALVQQSDLHLIIVESNLDQVQSFRQQWTKAGLYGTRIALVPGDAKSVQLPPYLAKVMICENPSQLDEEGLANAYQSLRPYGGTFCILNAETFGKSLAPQKLVNAKVSTSGNLMTIVREGALPGSANWTHEHADASNTRVSRDVLAKAPMGVLWFGGPPNDGILPRHGHGPQPQVVDGRMIIEGVDLMRALDIYTGRLLWETKMQGVGYFYNNLAHQPGANSAGSNFVSTPDGIYIAYHNKCVRLNPETGKKVGEYPMPILPGMKDSPRWGYINVVGDFLIGGADPLFDPKLVPPPPKEGETGNDKDPEPKKTTEKKSTVKEPEKKEPEKKLSTKESALNKLIKIAKGFSDNMSASRHLVVMDRQTGKTLWTAPAQFAFRHNAICVGNGRLYAIDRISGEQLLRLQKENGDVEPPPARLVAFDLNTGKELWSTTTNVFGTWLSYSEKHDMLFEAGRVARDSLFDEPKGIRAYSARDGKPIWFEKNHAGPAMIHHDTVLQDQAACDLLTGKLKMRSDPITGESVPWKWVRNYGCNTPAASEHLLTFRSGAAGYFDLCNDGGTGNFGGFRSSCTNNLIVAGGILTAPDYTRTCTCAYQNQTSIALIHMPEAEMWTSFGTKDVKGIVQRLGLNFGGAGDRKADDGTLWLEYPSIGGTSPAVEVATRPAAPELFRRHSSAVIGTHNWITSSGVKNIQQVTVTLGKMEAPRNYTVKLYFAEPDRAAIGERVFSVSIGGNVVLKDFDIVKEANGAGRTVFREFKGVSVNGELVLDFTPSAQAANRTPLLCGLELIAETK